jgi:hypothetical protein
MTNKLPKLIMITTLALLLAACGTNAGADVPSLETENERQVEPAADEAEETLDEEAMVMNFVQCMREQGIEYMDPAVDAEGNVQAPEFVEGVSITREELAEPYGVCAHHIEGFTFGRERADVSDQVDAILHTMSCLREKGYDVDDPTVETFQQWAIDFRSTFDWDDPDAQAAYEECLAQ